MAKNGCPARLLLNPKPDYVWFPQPAAHFTPEPFQANQALIDLPGRIAKKKNATPAQTAVYGPIKCPGSTLPVSGLNIFTLLQTGLHDDPSPRERFGCANFSETCFHNLSFGLIRRKFSAGWIRD